MAFLVFVAPGAAFEVTAHRYRPALRTTTFREVNAVILASLAAWTPVALFALVPRIASESWLDGPLTLLVGPSDDVPDAPLDALILVILALVAVGLAVAVAYHLYADENSLLEETGWYVALRRPAALGLRPYLWITTKEGVLHGGFLVGADLRDVPMADRDITIGPPLRIRHPKSPAPSDVEGAERIIVNGGDISSISVVYVAIE